MEKITVEFLRKLFNKKKRYGCVSCARGANSRVYYAVNGNEKIEAKGIKLVKNVFRKSAIPCKFKYSFTILEPYVTNEIIDEGYVFCRTLELFPYLHKMPFRLLNERLYVKKVGLSFYTPRYFSCAEKKILGYTDQKHIQIKELYATTAPCYHCLPAIRTINYPTKNFTQMKTLYRTGIAKIDGLITTYYLYEQLK